VNAKEISDFIRFRVVVVDTLRVRAKSNEGKVLAASVAVHHKRKYVASGASNEDEGKEDAVYPRAKRG